MLNGIESRPAPSLVVDDHLAALFGFSEVKVEDLQPGDSILVERYGWGTWNALIISAIPNVDYGAHPPGAASGLVKVLFLRSGDGVFFQDYYAMGRRALVFRG
jgi:hypothetical protein